MKHFGNDPFRRPMRPDRIDLIRVTAEVFSADSEGHDLAKRCVSFEQYRTCLTLNIFEALRSLWPDTTVAEIEVGIAEADQICRGEFNAASS